MRYKTSWAACLPVLSWASLDVAAAFFNAPLPGGRVVVLPSSNHPLQTQSLTPNHVWLFQAVYGLREAPNLRSEGWPGALAKLTFYFWRRALVRFCGTDPSILVLERPPGVCTGLYRITLHLLIIKVSLLGFLRKSWPWETFTLMTFTLRVLLL